MRTNASSHFVNPVSTGTGSCLRKEPFSKTRVYRERGYHNERNFIMKSVLINTTQTAINQSGEQGGASSQETADLYPPLGNHSSTFSVQPELPPTQGFDSKCTADSVILQGDIWNKAQSSTFSSRPDSIRTGT
ncbi:hypothetical protein STEG23_022722 [Scotinomys teguina]